MTPTYEDLQAQLIDWLRPQRAGILKVTNVKLDDELSKKCESIIPATPNLLLSVAISNPKLRQINFEGSTDILDIISDNIYRQLYLFGLEWIRVAKQQAEIQQEFGGYLEENNGTV